MSETTDRRSHIERVEREDLVTFVNACFACTAQHEFYRDARGQYVTLQFLHEYILGNYRTLYARTLAAGINHLNAGLIVFNLLSSGAPTLPEARQEEGRLIARALDRLPPQRVLKLFARLRERRVNNRRTRAVMREFLETRPDPAHHAVKYRRLVRGAVRHVHAAPAMPADLKPFLFEGARRREAYDTPLFEAFRRARYDRRALSELPSTVAEGHAARRGMAREEFLERRPSLTTHEALRVQNEAARLDVDVPLELGRVPLTRIASYIVSLEPTQRADMRERLGAALQSSARRTLRRTPLRLGRVAAILDRSRSSAGSSVKRRRPLAVALAASALLRLAAREYRAFWTSGPDAVTGPAQDKILATPAGAITEHAHDKDLVAPAGIITEPAQDEILVTPAGATDLATPLLDALAWRPEVVLVISDGFENSPPGAFSEVVRLYHAHLAPAERRAEASVSIIHFNPVFDDLAWAPRPLSPLVPTVGLRDAEDIPTMIGFARFVDGSAPLHELEAYLGERMGEFLA